MSLYRLYRDYFFSLILRHLYLFSIFFTDYRYFAEEEKFNAVYKQVMTVMHLDTDAEYVGYFE